MSILEMAAEMLNCRDIEELKGAFPRVVTTIEETDRLLNKLDACIRSRQIIALIIALCKTDEK